MDFMLTLVDLAGSIALLLWGVHLVQSAVRRAFGARSKPITRALAGGLAPRELVVRSSAGAMCSVE